MLSAIYQRYEELWEKGYWEPPPVPLDEDSWCELLKLNRNDILRRRAGRSGAGGRGSRDSVITYDSSSGEADGNREEAPSEEEEEEPPTKRQRKTGRYLAMKEAAQMMNNSRRATGEI